MLTVHGNEHRTEEGDGGWEQGDKGRFGGKTGVRHGLHADGSDLCLTPRDALSSGSERARGPRVGGGPCLFLTALSPSRNSSSSLCVLPTSGWSSRAGHCVRGNGLIKLNSGYICTAKTVLSRNRKRGVLSPSCSEKDDRGQPVVRRPTVFLPTCRSHTLPSSML